MTCFERGNVFGLEYVRDTQGKPPILVELVDIDLELMSTTTMGEGNYSFATVGKTPLFISSIPGGAGVFVGFYSFQLVQLSQFIAGLHPSNNWRMLSIRGIKSVPPLPWW